MLDKRPWILFMKTECTIHRQSFIANLTCCVGKVVQGQLSPLLAERPAVDRTWRSLTNNEGGHSAFSSNNLRCFPVHEDLSLLVYVRECRQYHSLSALTRCRTLANVSISLSVDAVCADISSASARQSPCSELGCAFMLATSCRYLNEMKWDKWRRNMKQ